MRLLGDRRPAVDCVLVQFNRVFNLVPSDLFLCKDISKRKEDA